MLILGFSLSLFIYSLLNEVFRDLLYSNNTQSYNLSILERNLTVDSLNSDDFWKELLEGPAEYNERNENFRREHKNFTTKKELLNSKTQRNSTFDQRIHSSSTSERSLATFVDSLFVVPPEDVELDWGVILGSFKHYGDQNWKQFVTNSDCPFLCRLFIAEASETYVIKRKFKPKKTRKKDFADIEVKTPSSSDYQVHVKVSTWLVSYKVKYYLKEPFMEYYPFGGGTKTTVYAATPRQIIQIKQTEDIKAVFIFHFNEEGFNLTMIDRIRMVIARRFLKRRRKHKL